MSQMGLKTDDLDLQAEIGLRKHCLINCECDNINFKLELCIDHLKFLDHFKNC